MISAFPDVEYLDVRKEHSQIVLTPVRLLRGRSGVGPWAAATQRRPTRVSAGVVGRWVSPGLAFRHAVSDAWFVEDVGGVGGVVA